MNLFKMVKYKKVYLYWVCILEYLLLSQSYFAL